MQVGGMRPRPASNGMDFALVYIAHRFVYRVFDFFHHWYVDGSRSFLIRFLTVFAGLEQSFAIRTTFAHFFEPLYKDYSTVGRILGVPFRVGRILLGGTFYLLFVAAFIALYMLWVMTPILCLMFASENIPPSELVSQAAAVGGRIGSWLIGLLKPSTLPWQ